MKKLIIIPILLLLLSTVVSAQGNFSAEEGYAWLYKQEQSGSFGNVFETSLSYLALKNVNEPIKTKKAVEWLKTQQNPTQGCFPSDNCNVQDTALALLVFNRAGEDTTQIENWLERAQSSALTQGKWWLQFVTSDSGTCTIAYNDGQSTYDVIIENGDVTNDCAVNNWLDMNSCLGPNFISSNPSIEMTIDCSALSDMIITAIYNSGNEYYIMEDIHQTTANLMINNGCLGTTWKRSCDYESSLYANWALNEIQNEINFLAYLKSNYDSKSVLHTALLYLITAEEDYKINLLGLQSRDGSYNKNVYLTALANLAIVENNATQWLMDEQNPSGSWNDNVRDTAMALYSSFPTATPDFPTCTDGQQNGDELGIDCGGSCPLECSLLNCGDGICDALGDENVISCVQDCFCGDGVCDAIELSEGKCPSDCPLPSHCSNGIIDVSNGETGVDCGGSCSSCEEICTSSFDCALDEFCVAGECVECVTNSDCGSGYICSNNICTTLGSATTPECTIDSDCASDEICDKGFCIGEGGGFNYILLIIILLVLIVIGAVVYLKFFKKSGKKKEEKTRTGFGAFKSPFAQKSKTEQELDKSIGEAQKLFKK